MTVPPRYPTAAVFIDESGSRASANELFVVAAIKVRQPGQLARAIRGVREQTGYGGEFKFSEISRNSIPVYGELVRATTPGSGS